MRSHSLHTSRLELAVPTPEDAPHVLAIAGDPRAVEHNPSDRLADLPEAEALLDRWIRHWREHGFGYWCVRETSHVEVVGYCGVKRMTAREEPVLNLIYRFSPTVWGRGYATEAAVAVLAWVDTHLPSETVLARVRPDNLASQNVASKAGLHRDPTLDSPGEDGTDLAFTNRAPQAVSAD